MLLPVIRKSALLSSANSNNLLSLLSLMMSKRILDEKAPPDIHSLELPRGIFLLVR